VTDQESSDDQAAWRQEQEERERADYSTWRGWAGPLEEAAVQPSSRSTVEHALDTCERFFGDEWLAAAVLRRRVPVMRIETWPLNQAHAVAHLVELGARLALLEPSGLLPDLRAGLNRNDTPQMFDHLRLVLETAGFALRKGWIVTMEERTAAGRFPDITVRRNATSYVIEVTRMDASRERRAVDRYGWLVDQHRWALGT